MKTPKRESYALFSRRIADQTEYDRAMTAHVEKTEKGYVIPLTAEMVTELGLTAGASVEVRRSANESVANDTPTIRYASVEEVLKAFDATLPNHREAYRELAK